MCGPRHMHRLQSCCAFFVGFSVELSQCGSGPLMGLWFAECESFMRACDHGITAHAKSTIHSTLLFPAVLLTALDCQQQHMLSRTSCCTCVEAAVTWCLHCCFVGWWL